MCSTAVMYPDWPPEAPLLPLCTDPFAAAAAGYHVIIDDNTAAR